METLETCYLSDKDTVWKVVRGGSVECRVSSHQSLEMITGWVEVGTLSCHENLVEFTGVLGSIWIIISGNFFGFKTLQHHLVRFSLGFFL